MRARRTLHLSTLLIILFFIWVTIDTGTGGELEPGAKAPEFDLDDTKGHSYTLSSLEKSELVILYFFDTDSYTSHEGLQSLDRLKNQFKSSDLRIWGISKSSQNEVNSFVMKHGVSFPVLLDNGQVSAHYDAELILPTIIVLDSELQIVEYFHGVGETNEKLLLALASQRLVAALLVMKSAPEGANLFIDGNMVGKTPLEVEVSARKHDVMLQLEGHGDWKAQVDMSKGGNIPISIRLLPK